MPCSKNARISFNSERWQLCKYLMVFTLCSIVAVYLGAKITMPQPQESQRRRLTLDVRMNPYTMNGARPSFWSYGPGGSELLYKCGKLPNGSCRLKGCNWVKGACTKCGVFDVAECADAGCDWSRHGKICSQCKMFHDEGDCVSKGCFWNEGAHKCAKTPAKKGKKSKGGKTGCALKTSTVSCAKKFGCIWKNSKCNERPCININGKGGCRADKKTCEWNENAQVCVPKDEDISKNYYLTESQRNQFQGVPKDFKLWKSIGQLMTEYYFLGTGKGDPPGL